MTCIQHCSIIQNSFKKSSVFLFFITFLYLNWFCSNSAHTRCHIMSHSCFGNCKGSPWMFYYVHNCHFNLELHANSCCIIFHYYHTVPSSQSIWLMSCSWTTLLMFSLMLFSLSGIAFLILFIIFLKLATPSIIIPNIFLLLLSFLVIANEFDTTYSVQIQHCLQLLYNLNLLCSVVM